MHEEWRRITTRSYSRLRRHARGTIARWPTTLRIWCRPTELVHETYLRFCRSPDVDCHEKEHFLALVCREMNRAAGDLLKFLRAKRRGGGRSRVDVDVDRLADLFRDAVLKADVNEWFDILSACLPHIAQVVQLVADGHGQRDVARSLGVTDRTVRKYLRIALHHWETRSLSRETRQ